MGIRHFTGKVVAAAVAVAEEAVTEAASEMLSQKLLYSDTPEAEKYVASDSPASVCVCVRQCETYQETEGEGDEESVEPATVALKGQGNTSSALVFSRALAHWQIDTNHRPPEP